MTSSEQPSAAVHARGDESGTGVSKDEPKTASPDGNGGPPALRARRNPLAQVSLPALALAAVALALLVVIVAEALGSRADPAEVQDIADRYAESTNALAIPVSEKQAKCRAEVYLESDLSDAALNDVRAGREPRPATERDSEVLAALAGSLAECL